MFKEFGTIADRLKNAGKIRESAEKAAESLAQIQVEGSAGGGTVTAKVSGKLQIVAIRIDPKLLADSFVVPDDALADVAAPYRRQAK